jgi:hypothetical protein
MKKAQNLQVGPLILASALLLFLILAGCSSPAPPATTQNASVPNIPAQPVACTDQDCFINAANNCESATLTLAENVGVFQFNSSDNCTLTKTLVSLDANETQDMKNALEGKSLTCSYAKGSFDSRLVTDILLGTENCNGSLKDALGELLSFT